ncbi:hypothetical protein [Anaerostipes faecalis]|uniref:hypothetical protein n=2 Tax=Lachnospiraceae TaxID=186803 RepID=UPI001E2A7A2A|nr:hypothetical protein [Anaerostipes faecalis]
MILSYVSDIIKQVEKQAMTGVIMGKILVEKISYTEVTKNISQTEYNKTQEEYILSKSPEKYMISLPIRVLMFKGVEEDPQFVYYFYEENHDDLYLVQRQRKGGVVFKTKYSLTKEQGRMILNGDYQFLLDNDDPSFNSLYFQFTVNKLHPTYKKECIRKIFHQNRFLDEIVDISIVRTPYTGEDFFADEPPKLKSVKANSLRRNTRQYLTLSKPMESLLNFQNTLLAQ